MYWTVVFSQERANNIMWSQQVMDVDASKKHVVLLNILAFLLLTVTLQPPTWQKSLLFVALVDWINVHNSPYSYSQ